jgi:hypothetical protein
MKKFIVFLLLTPLIIFGQTSSDYKKYIPKDIIIKPITDSLNFVDDSLRILMINYFKERNVDIKNCFIDKFVRQNASSITVTIRDLQDLKNEKEFAKTNKMRQNYQSIGGTFEYDKKTKKLVFYADQ